MNADHSMPAIRYTIRRRAVPKVSILCVPPGGRPGRCI